MALYCPDCGVHGRLSKEVDEETDEVIGFECDRCHQLFEDPCDEGEDE